jgi:mutual gliding-motility protein MglA
MLDANLESLANLRDNFSDMGIDLADFPMVLQFNKRDLPDVLSVDELNTALNPRMIPFFEAVAMTGEGVLKTFTSVSKQVLQDMQKHPERHNFSIGDIVSRGDKPAVAPLDPAEPEPSSFGDAAMADAKPAMAALEAAVEAGMNVHLGQPHMEDSQIILPFEVVTDGREDLFQLRVTIDMDAPLAKRFKVFVKNVKK